MPLINRCGDNNQSSARCAPLCRGARRVAARIRGSRLSCPRAADRRRPPAAVRHRRASGQADRLRDRGPPPREFVRIEPVQAPSDALQLVAPLTPCRRTARRTCGPSGAGLAAFPPPTRSSATQACPASEIDSGPAAGSPERRSRRPLPIMIRQHLGGPLLQGFVQDLEPQFGQSRRERDLPPQRREGDEQQLALAPAGRADRSSTSACACRSSGANANSGQPVVSRAAPQPVQRLLETPLSLLSASPRC